MCGPAISKEHKDEDRRVLIFNKLLKMHAYISTDKYQKSHFYTIPVIVDDVLDDKYMTQHKLEYKTVEEIISVISQKTYIFLDSLSSTYELGLFDNSLSKSTVSLFLEKDHNSKRHQRKVGEYILRSIKEDRIIEYDAVYDANGKEYVSFPKDIKGKTFIPKQILNQLEFDFENLHQRASKGFNIVFTNEKVKQINEIRYSWSPVDNRMSFSIGVRLAFYLAIMFFSKNEILKMTTVANYMNEFDKFKRFIFNLYLTRETEGMDKGLDYRIILSKPDIELNFGLYDNSFDIFRYFICIAERISYSVNKSSNQNAKLLRTKKNYEMNIEKDWKYFDSLLNITDCDKTLIKNYSNNPNEYVESITMMISGKRRKIIKYKNSHKGRHLRRLHEKISHILTTYLKPSSYAYAYKKDSSTKLCVERHINSMSFAKMDIHSFFNSIHLSNLSIVLKKRLINTIGMFYGKAVPRYIFLEAILKCCFYGGKLPLGFVTSPILSDIYMHEFDIIVGDQYEDLIYTRYADDILVSSKKKNKKLKYCVSFIKERLNEIGLEMNTKKKAVVRFKNNGESIHFLGVNIVYRGNFNELTISKKHIIEAAYKINAEITKKKTDSSVINGIKNYISQISEKSLSKLKKTYFAIFKKELP